MIISSKLWLQPATFILFAIFFAKNVPHFYDKGGNVLLLFLGSWIPVVAYWINGIGGSKPNEKEAFVGKDEARYPPVDKRLLFSEPTGIIMGKYHAKYVCKKLNEDGHVFLIGGSGSGKSSCFVIPAILANPEARVFAVDIKGELNFKTKKRGAQNVAVIDPGDRSQHGYDPLYSLSENSSTQEILETMQNIAFSLISIPAGLKDPFWKTSARNLLTGLLVYYYRQGTRDFVAIVDEILGRPVAESIKAVMENAKPTSPEYRYIVEFSEMQEQTLGGIVAEVNNHIMIFANDQAIRYAFKGNPNKANPLMLEEGYSVFLAIKEEKLSAYYDVLQLVINQTLAQLERRPEDSEPIVFIIDELARILSAGKMDGLLDGARTLRSRKVSLFLITQSIEGLMSAYSETDVDDLISNCPYIIVLSASSRKTQQAVISWCGTFHVQKTSWSGGKTDRKTTISYEEKDIVDASDLMSLKDAGSTGEAIVITPYGYSRVAKVPYYRDKILKPLADEVIKNNKAITG